VAALLLLGVVAGGLPFSGGNDGGERRYRRDCANANANAKPAFVSAFPEYHHYARRRAAAGGPSAERRSC
jgi:hypothetical protein